MVLEPITNAKEIRTAYNTMAATLTEGAVRFKRDIGYQGGGGAYTVYWRPAERYWSLLESAVATNRYWCGFGTDDPTKQQSLSITCEINPPFRGFNRRCAGIFLRDEFGAVYVAHSGRVGGGRKGIGRLAFLQTFGTSKWTKEVRWPDGIETTVILLERVNSSRLPKAIAAFVQKVSRFKEDSVIKA